ncbi:MAG: TetR/AcrR family transcriptional regulator [Luminiphilus sp.]
MSVEYPIRTKKKNLNREKLLVAATTLFSRNGYVDSTLDQVASEAGLHVQTLYRHFKTKDELAIAAAEITIRDCRARFEKDFPKLSAFQIWRGWISDSVLLLTSLGLGDHKRQQLRFSSSLMNDNFLLIIYSGYEDILTEYLARDFELNPQKYPLPRLVACMLWSGNEAAMKRCAGLDTEKDLLGSNKFVLDESLKVISEVEKAFSGYVKTPRP